MITSFPVQVFAGQPAYLDVQFCASPDGAYVAGAITANATAIATKRTWRVRPDVPNRPYTAFDEFELNAGSVLQQAAWNAVTERWDIQTMQTVPLSVQYNQQTGVARVSIPFGQTFNENPPGETNVGASPRRYGYGVYWNGRAVLTGSISISSAPTPARAAANVCSAAVAVTNSPAGVAAQPGGPWLIGG
jgi:hypothetical protein